MVSLQRTQFVDGLSRLLNAVRVLHRLARALGGAPLTWDRVDLDDSRNKEGRTFPFSAVPRLEELLKVQSKNGNRVFNVGYRKVLEAWRTATEKAGLCGMILHDLRRSAVRNLERAGVPRSIAMQLTGHKTEAVYRRYDIVDEADLREGVEKLAAHVEPQRKPKLKAV